jgi:glyoxylase-like metal-dependent hydrolase (beta-lactamase superfamily II)
MDGCGATHGEAGADEALFEVRKVADGVHVAVAAPAYKVNSNTAIVETDDGVLIVDSHSKPSAARVIVERVRGLTAKPVRYVVNTHFHWDHWQGNEVYPAAYGHVEVITNDITREAMVRRSLKRIQDHVRTVPAEIAQLQAQLGAATDPARRVELQSNLRQAEAYLAELRGLHPALPTMAFERTMRLISRDREIHLLHLGRAHTEGDVFVYLPKEKVVVTGDAVIGWTPFMGDGYPEDWVETLRRLERLDFDRMIMGHGQPAGKEWLRLFRGYVEDLVEAVRREAAAGATLDEVKQRVPDRIAPTYEAPLTRGGGTYRPWRQLVLGNIERVYAMVS